MMAERLTTHKGYRGPNGKAYNSKHNQRESFEKPQEGDTPPPENVYWDFSGGSPENSFSENEMRFYRRSFGGYLRRKNQNAKDRRQYGRMETMERYKEKHPPEETLLYIGRKDVDPQVLCDIFEDFKDWQISQWKRNQGGFQLLNAALHLDEKTPHIQFRGVYMYVDKNGDWQVSQNKALEILGYERPDPSKPISRMNNAKMTYTARCREVLFEIAREHGVELETEPLPKDEVGLPLKEYIQRETAREAAETEKQVARQEIAALEDEVDTLGEKKTALEAEISDLEDSKEWAAEDLARIRKGAAREIEYREQKRREVEEEAKKEAEKLLENARKQAAELREVAIQEGATSARGRMRAMLRAEQAKEQGQEGQEGAFEYDGR